MGPLGRRMVEELIAMVRDMGRDMLPAELTDEEREAFVRWDSRRLNELCGSLHLLISIPGLGSH